MISHMHRYVDSKQRLATELLHDLHAKDRQISRASLCAVLNKKLHTQNKNKWQRQQQHHHHQVFYYNRKKERELNPEDNLMLFLVHICSMNQPQKTCFSNKFGKFMTQRAVVFEFRISMCEQVTFRNIGALWPCIFMPSP